MDGRFSGFVACAAQRIAAFACILALAPSDTAPAQCGHPLFAPAVNYAAGEHPRSIALADLDSDGRIDIAAMDHVETAGIPSLSILLNNGDGSFASAVGYYSGTYLTRVTAADVNGDGWVDLVVTSFSNDLMRVIFNQGHSVFVGGLTYGVGDGPVSVAAGDLDGDGCLDLAVSNWYGDSVSVLFNNGVGWFLSQTMYGAGDGAASVGLSDLDGDGWLDIVVANQLSADVSVLLNNGAGLFTPAPTVSVGDSPRSVAVADLNDDGHPDLVTANRLSDNVSVLLNNGDATFEPQSVYACGEDPLSVALGDLNADGWLDIATANNQSNDLSVLLNVGDGTFASAVGYVLHEGPVSVATADVNGDSLNDIAVANWDSFDVSILLNQCLPSIEPALDIKPGSCPNSFNRASNGVLPVALVGAADFDIAMIDVSTIAMVRADGVGGSVAPMVGPPGPHPVQADVATPFAGEPCDCHELEADGIVDLSMKFDSALLAQELELNGLPGGSDVELTVSGNLLDGAPFTATDCLRLVPPAGGSLRAEPVQRSADLDGDKVVNVLDLLAVLAAWGAPDGPADLNADGIVNVLDLLEVLAAWGSC